MYRRGFTLFEIVLTASLIGVVYFFVMFSFNSSFLKQEVQKKSVLSFLKRFEYQQQMQVQCLQNRYVCLIYLDGSFVEEFTNPFDQISAVYEYSSDQKRMDFAATVYDERYEEVAFSLVFDKTKHHNALFVEDANGVFLIHPFYSAVQEFESLHEFWRQQENMLSEVRDVL